MPKFFEQLDENYIEENFNGLFVIGDVHGILDSYTNAINYALEKNLYVVSLGDLVDYGPNSKEVIVLSEKLHSEKKFSVVLGNHERKLFKYFIQNSEGKVRITIKPAIQASIDSFGNDQASINAFTTLHSSMVNVIKYKNNYFTHGALNAVLLKNTEYAPIAYQMALFGEIDPTLAKREDGYPNRIYEWVSKLPNDIKVFVGHDIRSRENPVTEGPVIFLDTGCGKEGFLSCAVLNIDGTLKEFVRF
jgi:predicted MPP superfamily phosphohydrolase